MKLTSSCKKWRSWGHSVQKRWYDQLPSNRRDLLHAAPENRTRTNGWKGGRIQPNMKKKTKHTQNLEQSSKKLLQFLFG